MLGLGIYYHFPGTASVDPSDLCTVAPNAIASLESVEAIANIDPMSITVSVEIERLDSVTGSTVQGTVKESDISGNAGC